MNDEALRAVFTLDGDSRRFTPAGHNLDLDKAEALRTRLQGKGLRVSTVVQTSRHKGHGYKNCVPCKTAAEDFSQQNIPVPQENGGDVSGESHAPID